MARWSHVLLALVLFLVHFSAREAAAQGSVYVEASGFADIKRFGSTSNIYYYGGGDDDFSLDGTGAGGGLRVGTFLHPRLSLELAIDAGTTTSSEVPDAYAILAIYPPLPRRDTKASTRFLSVSTIVGYHPPARGRLKLGYLAGITFVRGVYKSDYPVYVLPAAGLPDFASVAAASASSPAFATIYPPPNLTLTERDMTTGAILGFEAAIDLTTHIALVPEVRALTFSMPDNGSGVFLIRPGIGVRFTY